jgi:hypothetical protein
LQHFEACPGAEAELFKPADLFRRTDELIDFSDFAATKNGK